MPGRRRRCAFRSAACTLVVCAGAWLPAFGSDAPDELTQADVARAIAAELASTPGRFGHARTDRVYAEAKLAPIWFAGPQPRPAVQVALRMLEAAGEHGLAADDYGIASLQHLVGAATRGAATNAAIARADVALTGATLRYLSDVANGRVPPQEVEPHYRVRRRDPAFAQRLHDAVASNELPALLTAAEPSFALYGRLKRLLAQYRKLAAEPPLRLPVPPSARFKVVVNDRYPAAPTLRALLVRLGDLAPEQAPADDDRYTQTLADGVRRFQARHGLAQDGVLGKETLAALHVAPAARVEQIALALERMRWLPAVASGPMIAINIPSYRLWALADATRDESPTLAMPVIVGQAMRTETPVFAGEMRFVEFSPYWNVPRNILRNELLPRLAANRRALAREAMEIVGADGRARDAAFVDDAALAALRAGEARLRQRPGTRNALGGVKFVLPNTMDIYLHDTPTRQLFERPRRDFSHGCIRVSDAVALAQFVLEGRPEWTRSAIESAMVAGVSRAVELARPVPVFVFYTTALVDSTGRALFLPDVYGHDRLLANALRRARPPAVTAQ